jgi:hypothetical protein
LLCLISYLDEFNNLKLITTKFQMLHRFSLQKQPIDASIHTNYLCPIF